MTLARADGPRAAEVADPAGPVTVIQRVLGARAEQLPAIVRRFHCRPEDAVGEGVFTVWQSTTPLGRLAAVLGRVPGATDATPVAVTIHRRPGPTSERWSRRFGADEIASVKHMEGALLIERIGRLEIAFELRVVDRRLWFVQRLARLRLAGDRTVVLPKALAPRVEVNVGATPDEQRLDVRAQVTAPLVGPVFGFAGELTEVAAP